MKEYFVDLHIHIGRTESGKPVKISGSKDLTIANIMGTAVNEKGLDMVGVIDCHVPEVQEEITSLIRSGSLEEHQGGGLRYGTTHLILGCEVEVKDEGYKPVHYLCYFPSLEHIKAFTQWLKPHMKNITLSSQRLYKSTRQLQQITMELEGIFIPAHIFTPFKGIYGSAVNRMEEICNLEEIDGVELGLSGNSEMADTISELEPFTFLTNSDAHSLGKIAREYQRIRMAEANFVELKKALHRREDRCVVTNFGLSPKLGKYHLSFCLTCKTPLDHYMNPCPNCGGNVLKGVLHRVHELASYSETKHPSHRASYQEQIPLDFFPGVGKKTIQKLFNYYKTEMNILHHVPISQVKKDFGENFATLLELSRQGKIVQEAGAGGIYGRVITK